MRKFKFISPILRRALLYGVAGLAAMGIFEEKAHRKLSSYHQETITIAGDNFLVEKEVERIRDQIYKEFKIPKISELNELKVTQGWKRAQRATYFKTRTKVEEEFRRQIEILSEKNRSNNNGGRKSKPSSRTPAQEEHFEEFRKTIEDRGRQLKEGEKK